MTTTIATMNTHTFSTRSGGSIRVPEELQPFVRNSELEFRYSTVRNGDAYAASLAIECRGEVFPTVGETFYQTPDGVWFRWEYTPGSAWGFDQGVLQLIGDPYQSSV